MTVGPDPSAIGDGGAAEEPVGRRRPLDRGWLPASGDVVVPRWLALIGGWSWRLVAGGAALLVVGTALQRLEVVVVPIVIATLLSTVLAPPTAWLRRRGLRPSIATLVVFALGIGSLVLIGLWIVPAFVREVSQVGKALTNGVDRLQHWLVTGPPKLSADQVARYRRQVGADLTSSTSGVISGIVTGARTALDVTVGVVLSIVLAFFFVKDGGTVVDAMVARTDPDGSRRFRQLADDLWFTLGGYVRGTAANGLVNATVLAIGLAIFRVPLIIPLAVLTFLGGFAPLVGAFIAGGAAMLVALADGGLTKALAVVALTVAIHNIEGYVVGPVVMGRAVRLPPAAVLVALSVGSVLIGLWGLLFAVPAAACGVAIYRWAFLEPTRTPLPEPDVRPDTGRQ